MATSAQFASIPNVETAQVSTANTNRDGTGTCALICSGPSTAAGSGVGKRLTRVTLARAGTASATVITFFVSYDGGTTKRLIAEAPMPSYTSSTTTAQSTVLVPELVGMVLPGSTGGQAVQLYAATTVATTINIHIESAAL